MSRATATFWSRALIGTILSFGPFLSGCGNEPQVTTRKVAKKDRTLVAYVPADERVWFVKLSGPTAFVDPMEDDFRQLLDGMTFDEDGDARFKLPEGWTKEPGPAMRYATYGDDGPINVAVTRLPADDPAADEYLALNVNRWLRELGQPPRSGSWRNEAEKRNELSKISVGETTAMLFDLRGNILPARTSTVLAAEPYIDYTAPEGWTEKPADQFRMAIFELPDGVEVTISSAGGSPVANINRWEGQLGLEPSSGEDLVSAMEQVTVSGRAGLLIKLVGERDADGDGEKEPAAIFGVIASSGEKQYFIKLTGPAEAAEAAEAEFREFLTTLEFG